MRPTRSAAFSPRLFLVACALGVLATGCEPAPFAVPEAPDLTALKEGFIAPSGSLARPSMLRISAEAERSVLMYDVTSPVLHELFETLDSVDGRDPSELSDFELSGPGFLVLTRLCAGWDEQDGRPGQLTLTATFDDRGFEPVVWGTFERCRELSGELQVEITGDVALEFEQERVDFGRLDGLRYVAMLDGRALIDGLDTPATARVRSSADGSAVESMVTARDGQVVYVERRGPTGARGFTGFQAADQLWHCDLAERSCSSSQASLSW